MTLGMTLLTCKGATLSMFQNWIFLIFVLVLYAGETCATNINECDSKPCINGATCKDMVNSYMCNCMPGYTGTNCEQDINECTTPSNPPCAHQALCTDLIADYSCDCSTVKTPSQNPFGGKNCSVEMTGCDNNDCGPKSQCLPQLATVSDSPITYSHGFTCDCDRGVTGSKCLNQTTMSFYGTSYIDIDELNNRTTSQMNSEPITVEFQFRTSIANSHIISMQNAAISDILSVYLQDGFLTSTLQSDATRIPISSLRLNDTKWHSITLTFVNNSVILESGSRRVVVASGFPSNVLLKFGSSFSHFVPRQNLTNIENFIGCMQDIKVKSNGSILVDLIATDDSLYRWIRSDGSLGTAFYNNTMSGCIREPQCNVTTCSGHGLCIDRFFTPRCACQRAYLGPSCNYSHYYSFGLGNKSDCSYGKFVIQSSPSWMTKFSTYFIVYTTSNLPFLFMPLGSDKDFFTLLLTENRTFLLNVTRDGAYDVSLMNRNPLASTDNKYEIEVMIVNGKEISLYVNGEMTSGSMNRSLSITVGTPFEFYLGDIDKRKQPCSSSRRKKRDVTSIQSVQAVIQGLSVGGNHIINKSTADSIGETVPAATTILTNADGGDTPLNNPICLTSPTYPCLHGGSCSDILYNDYVCKCPKEWRGRSCQDKALCAQYGDNLCRSTVPGSTCQDRESAALPIGFDCILEATFNDTLSTRALTYDTNMTLLGSPPHYSPPTITFNIRTRDTHAVIVLLTYSSYNVSVRLNTSSLIVSYLTAGKMPNELTFAASLSNGQWNLVEIDFSADLSVDVKINRTSVGKVSGSWNTASFRSNLLSGLTRLTLANEMKGCLGEVRVGDRMAPFFRPSDELKANSSDFFFLTSYPPTTGCMGDDVCGTKPSNSNPCENNATCLDEFNQYSCTCQHGYNGTNCSNEINYCEWPVHQDCSGQGRCVRQIGNYSCSCYNGYEGDNCKDEINECEPSNPCQHGAPCINLIADYRCNCSGTNYTGKNCSIPVSQNCSDNLCKNGATCINQTTTDIFISFVCKCPIEYEGSVCDRKKDFCKGSDCTAPDRNNYPDSHLSRCFDNYTSEECECREGFNRTTPFKPGTSIVNTQCTVRDFCLGFPCRNRGTCSADFPGYKCACDLGYSGPDCGTPDCNQKGSDNRKELCGNNSPCRTNSTHWFCECADHTYGTRCEETGFCYGNYNHCQNGGLCKDSEANHRLFDRCDCKPGWNGTLCEIDIDECLTQPGICNEGTCENSPSGSFTCRCPTNYVGNTCYAMNPCKNATLCPSPSTGAKCDFDAHDRNQSVTFSCIKATATNPPPAKSSFPVELVVGLCLAVLLIAIIIALIFFVRTAKRKRRLEGTYNPSQLENDRPRYEMDNIIKPPPEERLI